MYKILYTSIIFLLIITTLFGCSNPKPRIIKGEELFLKAVFYQSPSMTWITNIVEEELDFQPGIDIGILDQFSIHIMDPISGILKDKIEFKKGIGIYSPAVINIKNGDFEIMSRSRDMGLYNKHGDVIWGYKETDEECSYGIGAGDIDRDVEYEFYLGTNKGIYRLNHKGEKIWKKNGWVYDIQIFNPDRGENPFVMTSCNDGYIRFRDANGALIKEIKPKIETKIYQLELCGWPSSESILVGFGYSFCVLDFNGNVVFEHKLKWSDVPSAIFDIRGVPVSFFKDQKPYLAVVTRFSAPSGLSMLWIFAPEGNLLYEELLNVTTGIASIKSLSPDGEVLLVGDGPGEVYCYKPKQKI